MTEQEDISYCYFTIEETWSRKISYFGHASLFLRDFDAFVWRLPKWTQANSQVYVLDECLNVWINEDRENLEVYHTKNNAADNNY